MITGDLPDSFEQLVTFGKQRDVKIRPVLLRVLVDMFVGKSHHGAAELRQFEEMMDHLLDDADDETRLAVAAKLSLDPNTPVGLLHRFVAERGAIAAKVLSSSRLDAASLRAAAVFGTEAMAVAVAGRSDLDPITLRCLAERPEGDVVLALVRNRAAPLDRALWRLLAHRAQLIQGLTIALIARKGDAAETQGLFFSAPPSARATMIAAARRHDLGVSGRGAHPVVPAETLASIDCAAMARGLEGLDLALGVALGLTSDEVHRLLDDPYGEPLALALAAAGISTELAARIFILGDPRVGHSFARVRALVGIVETVSARAAWKLVAGMLDRAAESPRRPSPLPPPEPQVRRGEPEPRRAEGATPALPVRYGHRA